MRSCKLTRSEAVKELPAMLRNFGFLCETYLVGLCDKVLSSLNVSGPALAFSGAFKNDLGLLSASLD